MPKKRKILTQGIHCACRSVCRRACIQCDAHHGGVPACRILRGMGTHLPAVSDRRLLFPEKQSKGKPEKSDADCHVGSVYLCNFFAEDSICDRKLFPYDRNRSGSGSVRTGLCQYTGNYCTDFPGSASGTRRSDHTGCQYIFHGHSRAAGVFRNLQTLSEDKDKQKSRNLSGSVSGRSVYLL